MFTGAGARRKRDDGRQDFQMLLKRLSPVEEHAWEIYDTLRSKLTWFFESDFALEAEDLADEVLSRIDRKLATDDIRDVAEFAFGVARNLRRETTRRSLVKRRLAASGAIGPPVEGLKDPEKSIIQQLDFEHKLSCLGKCLRRLDPEDRRALSIYYPQDGSNLEQRREALARELHMPLGTLRTRMARLREQLEKCFESCYSARRPRQVTGDKGDQYMKIKR